MSKFQRDLMEGEELENKVIERLGKEGFNLIKNPNNKDIDLLIIKGGIEVKCDKMSKITGNFYVEFECNGKASGIFKEDEYELERWVHSDGDRLFMIKGQEFQEWCKEKIDLCRANKSNTSKGFRVSEMGGDGGRSVGLLVPVKKLEEKADLIYNL